MQNLPLQIITDALVVRPGAAPTHESVIIEGDTILDITAEPPGSLLLSRDDVEMISGEGCYLTPGLIDQHINGAFGCDFNQASITDIHRCLSLLPRFGVTTIVPAVITAGFEDMLCAVNTLEEVIHLEKPDQCRIYGLHLEGPFLNPQYRGTHPAADCVSIKTPGALENLLMLLSPNVRMVTLAPEQDPTGAITQMLRERHIHVLAGHSNATHEEMLRAVESGITGIAHLFNAMRPFHHREPGLAGLGLTDERLYVEIIGDGIHLHPEAIRLILAAKPFERIILTSDAMALAGMPDGSASVFAQQQVVRKSGRAVNQEGHLAGSASLLNDCVKNMVHWGLASFEKAIELASTHPAQFLGLGEDYGKLESGYQADLVLWDQKTLEVKACWIGGKTVYAEQDLRRSPAAL